MWGLKKLLRAFITKESSLSEKQELRLWIMLSTNWSHTGAATFRCSVESRDCVPLIRSAVIDNCCHYPSRNWNCLSVVKVNGLGPYRFLLRIETNDANLRRLISYFRFPCLTTWIFRKLQSQGFGLFEPFTIFWAKLGNLLPMAQIAIASAISVMRTFDKRASQKQF